jgi:uncharacterized phage protein (TIGR02220 family)
MAKDPAFLFYSQDFITGTLAMPFDERGRYITLLCYQHQTGRMSEETIRFLVGSFSDILRLKFKCDENGLFFNERLEIEIGKRYKFIESRINNGKLGGRPKEIKKSLGKPLGKPLGLPSENLIENENVIENVIKYLNEKVKREFSSKTKNTIKHISARISEGFKLEDFKKVIDFKSDKWLNDEKMNEFLRPDTLFGSKFESYLNASKNYKIEIFNPLAYKPKRVL